MTRDERIEAMRKLAARHPDPTTWLTGDINFLLAELDAATQKLADYEAAAKYPGDDQRHRGASVASQLVHAQHMREQAEAERDEALAHNAKLTERVQRLTEALTAIDCAYRLRQTCIEANRRPELMCSRCAALAEGED